MFSRLAVVSDLEQVRRIGWPCFVLNGRSRIVAVGCSTSSKTISPATNLRRPSYSCPVRNCSRRSWSVRSSVGASRNYWPRRPWSVRTSVGASRKSLARTILRSQSQDDNLKDHLVVRKGSAISTSAPRERSAAILTKTATSVSIPYPRTTNGAGRRTSLAMSTPMRYRRSEKLLAAACVGALQ